MKKTAITTTLPAGKKRAVGYLRVSTTGQEVEKNKADILKLANDKDLGRVEFIEEKVSGKVTWKQRKIAEILDGLQKGDSIIVSELSRLGRSMLEVMEILSIALQRGVFIFSVKGNWTLDDSIQSKVVAMAFSMASEIEHELIVQRTTEALRHRKASGLPMGRPVGSGSSKLDKYRPEIEALLANGSSQRFIAERYDTTPENLSVWLKKNKINRLKLKAEGAKRVFNESDNRL
jgi:DNA invertase Pin-like site-specific DNA recombinase